MYKKKKKIHLCNPKKYVNKIEILYRSKQMSAFLHGKTILQYLVCMMRAIEGGGVGQVNKNQNKN